MGIKGNFKTSLLKIYKNCSSQITLKSLSNKIIAVDISTLMYNYKSWSSKWIDDLIKYLTYLKESNIELYIVFEGKACD